MRVAIFAHGRGRGHATRCEELQYHLQSKNVEAHLFAGGRAFEVLGSRPYVHETDVLLPGPRELARLPGFVARARRELRKLGATAVVSDGSAAAVLAARRERLPVIAMGHDVVFQLPAPHQRGARLPLFKQRVNAWHLHFADAWVGAHFLAEPKAPVRRKDGERSIEIGRPSLLGLDPTQSRDAGHLVVYLRDQEMLPALFPLSRVPRRQFFFGPKEWAPEWMEAGGSERAEFLRQLGGAHAVVGSAGSNLIAEGIAMKKPLLLLHRSNEAEQSLNAGWVTAAGLGRGMPFAHFDSKKLDRFLQDVQQARFSHFDLLTHLSPIVDLVENRLRALS